MTGETNTFRALHERPGAFVIPNPWDIGSARILAGIGFEALATTSWGMAAGLGVREGKVSLEATLDHCRMLVGATALPVSADLEKGIGDSPEDAAETIRVAAETGLAGCSLEDFTGDLRTPIFDDGLAVERIAAAAEARSALPNDFVLTARAEALCYSSDDREAVIRRLQAFEAAGADVLYAPGLYDLSAIREVCDAISKPVNIVLGMPGATFSIAQLAEAGVRRISVGSAFFRVAYGAMMDAAREIAEHGTFEQTQRGKGFAEIETLFDQ